MSGVAAIFAWINRGCLKDSVRRMLDAVPHRATDGRMQVSGECCALGVARFQARAPAPHATPLVRDQARRLWVAADLRLDNRDELREQLGSPGASDTELLVLGYERWGTRVSAKLAGDFAFVVCDLARHEVYAARDPFGVRPLFFNATAERLALASEVSQLLALGDVPRDIDDHAVREYLLGTYGCERNTFFRHISRVPPGHFLRAHAGEVHLERYWVPPREPLGFRHTEEYVEEFRRVFQVAVTARLDTDRPLVAQLSGGIDSSAIACMADAIYKSSPEDRPSLHLASKVYPGMECDETPYIDAVARRVAFPSVRYACMPGPASAYAFELAHPARSPVVSATDSWLKMAADAQARVVLSGVGGDELLFERGIFRDLLAHGRFLDLYREATLAPRYSTRSRGFYLRDALVSSIPPKAVRAYRRVRKRKLPAPPSWLSARLRGTSAPLALPSLLPRAAWASHMQEWTWNWLTSVRLAWLLETEELVAARAGLELRYPFFDVRLVRLVLAIPYEHRLPGGHMKLLLRRALEDLLPPTITWRTGVTHFGSIVEKSLQCTAPIVRDVLLDGRWESEPYVDQREARKLLGAAPDAQGTPYTQAMRAAWDIAMLELWLRHLRAANQARAADPR